MKWEFYVLEFLEQRLERPISDVESCYIALHLGAASERMNSVRKYRAVMILPHNQSFSDMCVKKISDMFRERMEVVKAFGYFEEDEVSALDRIYFSAPFHWSTDWMWRLFPLTCLWTRKQSQRFSRPLTGWIKKASVWSLHPISGT